MDRVVFNMPKDDVRDFMVAANVAQAYQYFVVGAISNGQRDKEFEVVFRMQEKFKYLEPILRMFKEYVPEYDYSGWDEWSRREFDCFIDFDFDRAWDFGKCLRFHSSMSLGILYGASPQRWPFLAALQMPKGFENKILLVDLVNGEELKSYLELNCPEWDIVIYTPGPDLESDFLLINKVAVVIGKAGFQTYVAGSLGKAVIEIFKDDREFVMYNSYGLRHYQAILGENVSAGVLWTEWEKMQEEISEGSWALSETISDTHKAEESILTGPSVSSVETAEEKSSVSTSQ